MGTPLEEADIINRFEIRLRNERAYYAVRDLLTYYDAEQTAFSIINQCVIMTLLDECVLLLSQMKGVLIVISDTQNAQSPTKEKKTYTVEEIAEQLDISKKVAYSLVKSGQFSYVCAGKAIRVSKVSFDKWLNGI